MAANWETVDSHFLDRAKSLESDSASALSYFDGRPPDWTDIVAEVAPQRGVVAELQAHLEQLSPSQRVGRLVVLLGPSGEGKSTALMQLARNLALTGAGTVLWRPTGASLEAEQLQGLPIGSHYFVFSDDGDEIAPTIYKFLTTDKRPDISFVVASRTVDWAAVGGATFPWRTVVGFRQVVLRGLDEEDAKLIVNAWASQGDVGLGTLANVVQGERVAKLLEATREQATTDEGAFFGGMLHVRFGELLMDRMRTLLRSLAGRRVGKGSLATALLHISAAHFAEVELTPNILANVLGVSGGEVRSSVIMPLSDEAVIASKQDLVWTRHALIAQAVVDIAEEFGADLPEVYGSITRSAIQVGRREFIAGYERFTYLCRRFETTNSSIAIATARAAVEEDPHILAYVHNLAHVLRIDERAQEASFICERACLNLATYEGKPHHFRAFYYEWASSEGTLGNRHVAIWLSAISLSDLTNTPAPSSQHAELALANIGGNLLTLTEPSKVELYELAVRAIETMSRQMDLSAKAAAFFGRQRKFADKWSVPPVPISECFTVLRTALKDSWKHRERHVGALPPAASLSFKGLAATLKIPLEAATKSAT
ncbi:hypothetical protein MWU75_11870 [Ornithinimicrobium sp. F0845]|uniref:P-loop NTPase n=1 Tax=Ornithinimicrobium sp. F0845 TaxID=2926412 RepID=UPI001FF22C64|nr:hypothetical protein [Ornithinimicrobium sp. F0845]MCK0112837.1 hypothetical protein [Ornithinimicrobium sp. F0845]